MWVCPGTAGSPRSLPGLSPGQHQSCRQLWNSPPGNALLFPKGTVPRGTAQAQPEPLWAWHRESCPFPTHPLGLHRPFWRLLGSSSTSRAVGESLPQPSCSLPQQLPPQPFPSAPGPPAWPPRTRWGTSGTAPAPQLLLGKVGTAPGPGPLRALRSSQIHPSFPCRASPAAGQGLTLRWARACASNDPKDHFPVREQLSLCSWWLKGM